MNSSSAGDSGPPGTQHTLPLSPEQIADLFPFHFIFDRSMQVCAAGPSLLRILPELIPGSDIKLAFSLERPLIGLDFELITALIRTLYILSHRKTGLRLRGQMVRLSTDEMVFLCSPWLPEPGALKASGLTLDDFPLHDSMPELLQVIQSQQLSMSDLRRMTEKLSSQRAALKAANKLLVEQSDEFRKLGLIASRTDNGVVITDANGVTEWVNEAFVRITGFTMAELIGHKPGRLLQGPESDPLTVAHMSKQLQKGEGFHSEVINYHKSGQKYWVDIEVQPMHDTEGRITNFMAIEKDITARRQADSARELSYSVTAILAQSTDADQALREILRIVCESVGYSFSVVWSIAPDRSQLRCHAIWSHPRLNGSAFETATRSITMGRGYGVPGRVWDDNRPHSISDVTEDGGYIRAAAARASGLHGCYSFPIRIGGEVWGVMEFYRESGEQSNESFLEMLAALGNQIGQFLGRREVERDRYDLVSLLDSTFESTRDGILITDIEGVPVRYNRLLLELLNLTPQLLEPSKSLALLDHLGALIQDFDGWYAARQGLLGFPEKILNDIIRLHDGRVLEVHSTPRSVGTQVVGRVWTYRDVTAEHSAQQSREQLLATLHATLESTTDGILVAGLDGSILIRNRRFCELLHIPPDPAVLKILGGVRALVAGQVSDPAAYHARIDWLYAHPEEPALDIIHCLDGRVFERYTQPQRSSQRIIGRVWSYRDTTDRWRANEALLESEERYRVVMESATDSIITIDDHGTVLFASRSAARTFGYDPTELPGMPALTLVPNELRSQDALRRAAAAGGYRQWRSVEVTGLKKDGTTFPVEISLHRSRVRGKRLLTGVLRDITQRKQAEAQLQQAMHEAESANRAKSDFLASVSHEIRTPLNAIIGLTEVLRESKVDPDQQDMLQTIWASSESLLHLINDILETSKIESGQIDVDSVEFNLREICEQTVEILNPRARMQGLRLYCVLADWRVPTLSGDPNRIRQILLNLLGNAVKFTEHGQVVLRASWNIEPSGHAAVEIRVEDTGVGIDDDAQLSIFEKFVRVDSPLARRVGGVGLGLSISRMLAEAMGGSLAVSSQLGRGSVFTLRLCLPVAPGQAADLAPLATPVLVFAPLEHAAPLGDTCRGAGVFAQIRAGQQSAIELADPETALHRVVIDSAFVWDESTALRFHRLISRRGPAQIILIAGSDGDALPAWAVGLPVRTVQFPLTPTRLRRALELSSSAAEPQHTPTNLRRFGLTSRPGTILVVEDNPDSRAYVIRVLQTNGHRVSVASTGSHAVAEARSHAFDVILMDVTLPDMTGFDATRLIRANESASGTARTPIVALTAHALQEYRQKAFASDMDDYLTKPVRMDTLLTTVARWLHSRGAIWHVADSGHAEPSIRSLMRPGSSQTLRTVASITPELEKALLLGQVFLILLDVTASPRTQIDTLQRVRGLSGSTVVSAICHGWKTTDRQAWELAGGGELIDAPPSADALRKLFGQWGATKAEPIVTIAVEAVVSVDSDIADLVPSYLDSVRTALTEVADMAGLGDANGIGSHAHKLKGSGESYGFGEVTRLASLIGDAAQANDFAAAAQLSREALDYLGKVRWYATP